MRFILMNYTLIDIRGLAHAIRIQENDYISA